MSSLPPSITPETIIDLVERDIATPPCYIEPSILTLGGQLILGAHAKTGKSFTLLELARALSSAQTPFDCPVFSVPRPVRVLLIDGELGEHGLKKRAERIYTPDEIHRLRNFKDNFLYVCKIPELKLDDKQGRSLLYNLCNEVQPNVLIIDPIGRFHNYDENDAQEISKLFSHLDEMQKLFKHNEMALIITQHMGKPKDKRAEMDELSPYEMRGSSKWFDNPDSIITMSRTHNLSTLWESWSLTMRFTLRHDTSPDDMIFHVNERNDGRVRYYKHKGTVGGPGKTLVRLLDKKVVEIPRQLGFAPA